MGWDRRNALHRLSGKPAQQALGAWSRTEGHIGLLYSRLPANVDWKFSVEGGCLFAHHCILATNQSLHMVWQVVGGHNYVLKAEWQFPREAGLL